MNWLLIVVIVIIAGSAFYGYCRGLLKMMFSVISLIVSIALSAILTPYITTWVNENTGIHDTVQERCEEWIVQKSDEAGITQTLDTVAYEVETLQSGIDTVLSAQEMPDVLKNMIEQNALSSFSDALAAETSIGTVIAGSLADTVVSAISFVITMLAIRIILMIVLAVLNAFSMLPVIRGINRTAGMICGFAMGLLIVWIFFVAITCMVQTPFGQSCIQMIAQSGILSVIYNHNLLTLFL